MNNVEEVYKGYNIHAEADQFAEDPLEWDVLGNYICYHGRYSLGTKHDFKEPEDLHRFLKTEKIAVEFPLYLYDHSGITISSTPFSCPWDSGQLGIAYATREEVRNWFGVKRAMKKHIQSARDIMLDQLKTYDDYLRGAVYYYFVTDEHGESVDLSCSGYYGDDHEVSGLLETARIEIDALIRYESKKRQDKVKKLCKHKVPLDVRQSLICS